MSKEEINLTHNVEKGDGINVNRGSGNSRDWNGIHYKTGMSSKNVGSKELSMNVATIEIMLVYRKEMSDTNTDRYVKKSHWK